MRAAWMIAALIALSGVVSGQSPGVLHVRATVVNAAGTAVPVARHALLISDNPATSEPRRVLTAADGRVSVRLRPGSYTVESDRPFAFLGKAYQWTQMVDVAAGETTIELNAGNAEVIAVTDLPATPGEPAPARDTSSLRVRWQDSVVEVWSPTAHASGFLVDARGLIATDRVAVGTAPTVEIQLSPTLKVPARTLVSDALPDVAIVWADPSVVSGRAPISLTCPPTSASSLDEGQEIVTLAAGLRTPADIVSGEVTALQARAVEADMRVPAGGAGGPVFDEAGSLVGLASLPSDPGVSRHSLFSDHH